MTTDTDENDTPQRPPPDSWSYLPVNQDPFPDRTVAERIETFLSFVVGALIGGPAGFSLFVLTVHADKVAGLEWDTAAWIFIVGCALAGGFLLARVKPTLR